MFVDQIHIKILDKILYGFKKSEGAFDCDYGLYSHHHNNQLYVQ